MNIVIPEKKRKKTKYFMRVNIVSNSEVRSRSDLHKSFSDTQQSLKRHIKYSHV